jgi:hypothetical protein
MFWGTRYVLVSGWKGTFIWASWWERKKNRRGKNKTSLGERLQFYYPVSRDLKTGRTRVKEKKIGKWIKYNMFCRTRSREVSVGKGTNN